MGGKKKTTYCITVILGILLLVLFSGCNLFGSFLTGEVFFYSMGIDGEDGTAADYSMYYRDNGYTVVMSRGIAGELLTEDEALVLEGSTTFSLTLDEVVVSASSAKGVRQLGNDGWHVIQSFNISGAQLSKGTHILLGETVGVRTNTVNLTIK